MNVFLGIYSYLAGQKFPEEEYILGRWRRVVWYVTRRNIPEDSYLQTCHRENLKSHIEIFAFMILEGSLECIQFQITSSSYRKTI
jgi:hypothetical protein